MTDTINREVYVVTFEPTEEGGEAIGGMDWRTTSVEGHMLYAEYVSDMSKTNTIALWSAYVPTEWDRDQTTEYLDDTFCGDTPDGYPIMVVNAPFENYPHRS